MVWQYVNFELRAEAYNVTNATNLTNPIVWSAAEWKKAELLAQPRLGFRPLESRCIFYAARLWRSAVQGE